MSSTLCFVNHSRSGTDHMRSWRHARNNRRRVCNYACFHLSRNLLHQTLKWPTPLVQSIKISCSNLRYIWSDCHVYIPFPCAWKSLDPRWRCQNMYIITGYVEHGLRYHHSTLTSFINHIPLLAETASLKPGMSFKDSTRVPFAALSPAIKGQTLVSPYTLHKRSTRSLGRWSG